MKILVISHTYITRVNREKWKVLSKLYDDVELKVIFPTRWPTHLFDHKVKKINGEDFKNCHFLALPAFNVGNEVAYGYFPRAFFYMMKDFRPDVVHVEQGDNALSYFQSILTAKILRINAKFLFFTWVNWEAHFSLKYCLFWKWIEKVNRFFSVGAIVGNQDAKKILQKKGFEKNVTVLPQLGVDSRLFVPAKQTKFNENQQNKYVCFVGRIVEEKGIKLLIDVFAKLSKLFPSWRLMFIGNGPYRKQLIDRVISYNILDRVKFKDPVAHSGVVKLLQHMDILVLPSFDTSNWKEQFGHVLIEAMACGVPVIGSSGGEIPNVIDKAGLVFEQKNEEELKKCLQKLMKDATLREKLRKDGCRRVLQNYTHDIIARKTYMFWKKMLG